MSRFPVILHLVWCWRWFWDSCLLLGSVLASCIFWVTIRGNVPPIAKILKALVLTVIVQMKSHKIFFSSSHKFGVSHNIPTYLCFSCLVSDFPLQRTCVVHLKILATQSHAYSCFMFSSSWKPFLSWSNSVIFRWGSRSNARIHVCIPTQSLSRAYVPSVVAEDEPPMCSVCLQCERAPGLRSWTLAQAIFLPGCLKGNKSQKSPIHLLRGLWGSLLHLRPRHQLTSMGWHFISGCEPAVDRVKSIGKNMPWSRRACFCFVSAAKNNYYKTLYIK